MPADESAFIRDLLSLTPSASELPNETSGYDVYRATKTDPLSQDNFNALPPEVQAYRLAINGLPDARFKQELTRALGTAVRDLGKSSTLADIRHLTADTRIKYLSAERIGLLLAIFGS